MKTFNQNKMIRYVFNMACFFSLILNSSNTCSAHEAEVADLMELPIEALMDVEVTLPDRKPRKLSQSSAAVFVVTNEDIRRSGATSIPEALRMVPGLHVARISSSKWAITSRGLNSRFAYMLQVLIDGRSVYTPLFSGVFWETQDLLLEDVERIEIIRGPGASLWGSNAVNGIINIITKHSRDTLGNLVSTGVGTEEKGFAGVRHGGRWGKNSTYRLYAKYFERDEAVGSEGGGSGDAWDMFRTGFRSDSHLSDSDELTLEGGVYHGEKDLTYVFPSLLEPYQKISEGDEIMTGTHILGRWQHTFRDDSEMFLQAYFYNSEYEEFNIRANEKIGDIDFQHRFSLGKRHEITWGIGYRFYSDDMCSSETMIFDPEQTQAHLFSAFLQDNIRLIKNRLRLTLGSKFEYRESVGFEIQPNIRLLWTPHRDHIFWTSASRAVKSPSRIDDTLDIRLGVLPPGSSDNPMPIPAEIIYSTDKDLKPQKVIALELGYRMKAIPHIAFDLAAFYNLYDDLAEAITGSPYFDTRTPSIVVPMSVDTRMEAQTWGIELALNWEAFRWWRLQTSYTFLQEKMSPETGISLIAEGTSPRHQISVRSSVNLPHDLELDMWFRHSDKVLARDIPAYSTMDLRLGWHPSENLEFSLVGQNLFDSAHLEFIDPSIFSDPAEIEQSMYVKMTWRF